MKVKLEYIWLDGYTPEPYLRSKTKVVDDTFCGLVPELDQLPIWSYDGSSTQQADGHYSDCLLKPVRVIRDPQRKKSFLVMTEVLKPDETPHESNKRHLLGEEDEDIWFGFEQEYTLIKSKRPLGFPEDGFPEPQGKYYCGVGFDKVNGRRIVEEHLDVCLEAGLNVTGINAEVLLGQWEYQLFAEGKKRSADDLWLSRYLLHRITEKWEVNVEFHPKPLKGDWNGSGLHSNFSTKEMREVGGKEYVKSICEAFGDRHDLHIENYGSCNDERLTGDHETAPIHMFSYGVSDRGCSIRIPVDMVNNGWKGYLEDRRPASNADPYRITYVITETLKNVKQYSQVDKLSYIK